jgi:hypothetical protein
MMHRRAPSKGASSAVPAQLASHGPSKKPSMPAAPKPAKSNLGAKVKRTSDLPKGK